MGNDRYNPEKDAQRIGVRASNSDRPVANETEIVYHAKVVSIEDPLNSKIIRVRIDGLDNHIKNDEDLPPCYSMMPSFFHCLPMVGEHVLCIFRTPWNKSFGRFWVGPIFAGDDTETQHFTTTLEAFKFNPRDKDKKNTEGRLA